MTVTMAELETVWSFEDLATAHDVLDVIADAQARAVDEARRDAQRGRR